MLEGLNHLTEPPIHERIAVCLGNPKQNIRMFAKPGIFPPLLLLYIRYKIMLENNGQEQTATQEQTAGKEATNQADAVDTNVISASFNFRPIAASAKDNKMALEMAKFDAASASYVVTREVTDDANSPIDNIKGKYPLSTSNNAECDGFKNSICRPGGHNSSECSLDAATRSF